MVERPLELAHREVDIGQGDVGGRVDTVLPVEPPVLLEPTIERPKGDRHRIGIVPEGVLIQDTESREQPDRAQTLFVHDRQAGIALTVVARDALPFPHVLVEGLALGVGPEVPVQAPGLDDGVEHRVGDRIVDLPPDDVADPAMDLGDVDGTAPQLRIEVPGEGVERLVVVVVGVERTDIAGDHPTKSGTRVRNVKPPSRAE